MREVTMTFTDKGDSTVGIAARKVAKVVLWVENLEEQDEAHDRLEIALWDTFPEFTHLTCEIKGGFPRQAVPSIYDEIKYLYEV